VGLIDQLIVQAMPILIQLMSDPVVAVRDTATWTVANIVKVLNPVFSFLCLYLYFFFVVALVILTVSTTLRPTSLSVM
jgi:hypothetical protein